jgi:hypothetical protein
VRSQAPHSAWVLHHTPLRCTPLASPAVFAYMRSGSIHPLPTELVLSAFDHFPPQCVLGDAVLTDLCHGFRWMGAPVLAQSHFLLPECTLGGYLAQQVALFYVAICRTFWQAPCFVRLHAELWCVEHQKLCQPSPLLIISRAPQAPETTCHNLCNGNFDWCLHFWLPCVSKYLVPQLFSSPCTHGVLTTS